MKILLLLFCLLINTSAGQELAVMRSLSSSIGDVVLECQSEMHFGDNIIRNFLNFWSQKDDLVDNDMGCVLLCVFMKMELIDHSGHVQKEETEVFVDAMGADKKVSTKIVELFDMCQRATRAIKEMCEFALQMTKCFRYGIFQLHWAPQYVKPEKPEWIKRRRGNKTKEFSMNTTNLFFDNRRSRSGRKQRRHGNKKTGF